MTDEILRCWIACCLLPRATIVKYKSHGNWTIANRKMMPAAQTQNRKVNPAPQMSCFFVYIPFVRWWRRSETSIWQIQKTNGSSHLGKMMLRQSSRRQQRSRVADPMQIDPEEASRILQLFERQMMDRK